MNTNRRNFIKTTAAAGLGFSILPSGIVFSKDKDAKINPLYNLMAD